MDLQSQYNFFLFFLESKCNYISFPLSFIQALRLKKTQWQKGLLVPNRNNSAGSNKSAHKRDQVFQILDKIMGEKELFVDNTHYLSRT